MTTTATEQQRACPHEGFRADVIVNRMADTGRFTAEIAVTCAQCALPFRFMGVPPGLAWDRPTCSIEGVTLHAPIEPEFERRLFTGASYHVPPELSQPKH